MSSCIFQTCMKLAAPNSTKCYFHRNRDKCEIEGCCKQACARKRCVSHGGKRTCQYAYCVSNARVGGFCGPHSITKRSKRLCMMDGCTKFAHARRRCVAHGGGRLCNVDHCKSQSRNGGFCQRHGGKCIKGKINIKPEPIDPSNEVWKYVGDFDFSVSTAATYHSLEKLEAVDQMTLDLLMTFEV